MAGPCVRFGIVHRHSCLENMRRQALACLAECRVFSECHGTLGNWSQEQLSLFRIPEAHAQRKPFLASARQKMVQMVQCSSFLLADHSHVPVCFTGHIVREVNGLQLCKGG